MEYMDTVVGININILECKWRRYTNNYSRIRCININILECKFWIYV